MSDDSNVIDFRPRPLAGELGTIVVCEGPPRCELLEDEAMAAQRAGCPLCTRIQIMADGSEIETKPVAQ